MVPANIDEHSIYDAEPLPEAIYPRHHLQMSAVVESIEESFDTLSVAEVTDVAATEGDANSLVNFARAERKRLQGNLISS